MELELIRIDAMSPADAASRTHRLAVMLGGNSESITVGQIIDLLIDGAPESLNTLNEIAAALADDQNFASTVLAAIALKADATALAQKLPLSGGSMTGPIENAIFASPGAATKRAHFDLTRVTAGQDRDIIVPDSAGLALSKWETIGDYTLAAAASLDITGLSAFRKIRATGHLYGSAVAAINLVTSTNNGGAWDTGASDYNAQIMQAQGTTLTGFSGNAAFIGLSGGVAVSNTVDDGLEFEFSIDNFNKGSRMKYVSKGFFVGAAGNYANTIGAQRLQATARNALRLIAASGTLSGTVLVEGVRG